MAIAHARTDTTQDIASATATLTVVKPTGVAATEVMIIVIVTEGGTNTLDTITPPVGHTRIGARVSQTNGGAEIVQVDVFWALGNVALMGYLNSITGSNVQQGVVCAAFSGVDNTNPIDVAGTGNSSTGVSTLVTNAITIVTNQSWHMIGSGDWTGGSAQTATGFTVSENAHANAATCLLYNTTPKSTGSTGTVTVNAGSGSTQIIVGQPFALAPAAGGGGATVSYLPLLGVG